MNQFHEINWNDEKVSRIWDYYAGNPAYDSQYFSRHSGMYIVEYAKKYYPKSLKSCLDYGCGPGFLMEHILNGTDGTVNGFDFSQVSVEKALSRNKGQARLGKIVAHNSLPIPFEDSSMDLIYCVEVVEHLNDQQLHGTLIELRRLLRKGGRLIITTPNEEDMDASKIACPECGCIFHKWQHLRRWSVESLTRSVMDYGFTVRHCEATIFQPQMQTWKRAAKGILRRIIGRPELQLPHLILVAE
jgi:SAM-dependent methyltransferase